MQKFGGSSLSDLDKLGGVADFIASRRRAGDALAVVVSAMGKTTEDLLKLAQQAARAKTAPRPGFEPPRREVDMLVSTGERVSMALLSIALGARDVPAVSFTGSQSGIITTGRHFDARIVEVRPERLQAELARGKVVIVAGYQGMSAEREITTLGRGGSDTTAVALAAALPAERCEIYSDVDGVYSADPNRVPEASHFEAIDYDTMEDMAAAGAKVLNRHAVCLAREKQLRLVARRTSDFVASGQGRETRVEPGAMPVHAIVVNSALGLVYAPHAARERVRDAAREAELPFHELPLAEDRPLGAISLFSVPDPLGARHTLERAIDGLSVVDGYAELSVVGARAEHAEACEAGLRLLPAPPLCMTRGRHRLTVIVPLDAVAAAERAWHQFWVERSGAGA